MTSRSCKRRMKVSTLSTTLFGIGSSDKIVASGRHLTRLGAISFKSIEDTDGKAVSRLLRAGRKAALGVQWRGLSRLCGSRVITLKYILCVNTAPESALFYPTRAVEKEVN